MPKFNILIFKKIKFILPLLILSIGLVGANKAFAEEVKLPICAYISSYTKDLSWQKGIMQGLSPVLKDVCQLRTFYMNTKQIRQTETLITIGQQAKSFIDNLQPDILIFSDDNAIKYVLMPYFNNHNIPAVFIGVNETGANYLLPYSNTTGMLERINFPHLFEMLFALKPGATHMTYLTSHGTSEKKAISSFHQSILKYHLRSSTHRTFTEVEWRARFLELNQDPNVNFILLGDIDALPEWNSAKNLAFVQQHTKKLTIALDYSLLPYAILGSTKCPKEQGKWAGMATTAILNSTSPSDIPVVPNRNFNYWYNPKLLQHHTPLFLGNEFRSIHSLVPSKSGL